MQCPDVALPTPELPRPSPSQPGSRAVADFYKACDEWGALSNFSPHPISLPGLSGGQPRQWACVEHYYQAMKFWGVPGAEATVESIAAAPSPEEAARIGRRTQRLSPELVRKGWDDEKVDVMRGALRAKFLAHKGPRELLLSTASGAPGGGALFLAEGSPHDTFWGRGRDGTGRNQLGALLMELRDELLADAGRGEELAELVGACDGS